MADIDFIMQEGKRRNEIPVAKIITAEEAAYRRGVKDTLEAIKKKSMRNSYACAISGLLHETYTIKGSTLEEIEKELLEGNSDGT
jgi:hypothetical protein